MDKKQTLEALKKLNSMMEDFLDMMEIENAEEDEPKKEPKKKED